MAIELTIEDDIYIMSGGTNLDKLATGTKLNIKGFEAKVTSFRKGVIYIAQRSDDNILAYKIRRLGEQGCRRYKFDPISLMVFKPRNDGLRMREAYAIFDEFLLW